MFQRHEGMPGPYIKLFLKSCGHEGLNHMLDGFVDRSAYAKTIVAFTSENGCNVHVFEGRTDGQIVKARGPKDFGWDSIFEPIEGNGKTYAEMTEKQKDSISHRKRSFEKLRSFLLERNNNIVM